MNNIWTPEHILPYIDKYENLIAHDIKKDCKKYGRTYENWQSHVESLRKFINNRGENLRSQVKSYFNLSDSDMKKYGF